MKETIAAILAAIASLEAERDAIVASDSISTEQEQRAEQIPTELETWRGKQRALNVRERFAAGVIRRGFSDHGSGGGRESDTEKRADELLRSKEYRDGWIGWLRGGPIPMLEHRSIISSSSGGILIPKIYEEPMAKYIDANTNVRNLCDLKTGIKGRPTIRRNNLASADFTNAWTPPDTGDTEATSIDPSFSEVTLAPATLLPLTTISQQTIRSSDFDIEAEIMDFLQRELAKNLEFGYVGGVSTANQPTGLFAVDANVNIKTATSTGATRALAITAGATFANLHSMRYEKLPASLWLRGCWILPQDFYAALAALTVNNVPIFVPSGDYQVLENAAPFTLLGLPVFVTEYSPTFVTTASAPNVLACLGKIDDVMAAREWAGISMIRDEISKKKDALVDFQGMMFAQSAIKLPKSLVQLQVANAA